MCHTGLRMLEGKPGPDLLGQRGRSRKRGWPGEPLVSWCWVNVEARSMCFSPLTTAALFLERVLFYKRGGGGMGKSSSSTIVLGLAAVRHGQRPPCALA